MTLRRFLSAAGIVAVLAGLAFITVIPTRVHDYYAGEVSCGPAYYTDGRAANDQDASNADRERAVDDLLGRRTNRPTLYDECRDATGSRRTWAIPLAVVGFVLALGAAVVRPSSQKPAAPLGTRTMSCPRCNAEQNVPLDDDSYECWQCKKQVEVKPK